MGAKSKRARKVRTAGEFDMRRMTAELAPPPAINAIFGWSLEDIVAARNQQMLGQFRNAARMAEAMRTDDALAVAYENRLAPQRCIQVELVGKKSGKGPMIAGEAEALFGREGVGVTADTLSDVNGYLANHGVAFARNIVTPREDGSRIDYAVASWPIEWVRWYPIERCFKTQTESGAIEPIVHGDGRWIVFQKHEIEPWKQEAAILSAALVWARHAFALNDWMKGSAAHGSAKVIGEMPAGLALQLEDGSLSPEAAAFLELLRAIASGNAPIGIRPAGSKTEFVSNNSTAWQVWKELVNDAKSAAACIYLGTDGTLGAQGGAPGVDIKSLFGVAATRVLGDLRAIERGLQTGTIEPWAATNFGDSSLAPSRRYLIPDADADAERDAIAARQTAFYDALDRIRALGFEFDQKLIDTTARTFGVDPPVLPVEADRAPTIALTSTDIARVVTVNEARASAGVGRLMMFDGVTPDPDGRMTVEAYSEKQKAASAAASRAPAPAPDAPGLPPLPAP